jgi:hypothetical protein
VAAYNEVTLELKCPRCHGTASMIVNLYFGFRDQLTYAVGDEIHWRDGRAVQNGGRPPGGNLDGEGYAECPLCKKDFFVVVEVRNDKLLGARPNPSRKPYIPD